MQSCHVCLASLAALLFQPIFAKVNLDDLAAWQEFYDSTNGSAWPDCSQLRNKPCLCGTDEPIIARQVESFYTYQLNIFIAGYGVQCKEIETEGSVMIEERIVGIAMPEWGLTGTLPPALNKMSELTHINLGNNNLRGSITPICGLQFLKHVALYGNRFEGSLPPCLGYFDDLRSLNLAGNLFRGKIPKSLGKLGELRDLVLNEQNTYREDELPTDEKKRSRCRLLKRAVGPLPGEKPLFYRADRTWTCGGLSGALPKELAGMVRVRVFHVAGNVLYDNLPDWLPASVESLDLSDNHFKTPWPKRWVKSGRRMVEFRLSYNDLQLSWSEIFPTLRGWADNIREVSLSGTGLNGHIPAMRYRLPGLIIFKIADNELMGEMPAHPGIRILDVRNNTRLYGCIEHNQIPICHTVAQQQTVHETEACLLDGTSLEVCNLKTIPEEDLEKYKDALQRHRDEREL